MSPSGEKVETYYLKMGLFSKNKQITSDEYDKLISKIVELKGDFQMIQKDFEIIKTNMNSLRGLINRKIGKEEEEEQSDKEPMTLEQIQKALMGLQ